MDSFLKFGFECAFTKQIKMKSKRWDIRKWEIVKIMRHKFSSIPLLKQFTRQNKKIHYQNTSG